MSVQSLRVNDEIELRLLQPQDAKIVFATINEHRAYLKRWLPWVDHNTEVADSSAFIESTRKQFEAGQGGE